MSQFQDQLAASKAQDPSNVSYYDYCWDVFVAIRSQIPELYEPWYEDNTLWWLSTFYFRCNIALDRTIEFEKLEFPSNRDTWNWVKGEPLSPEVAENLRIVIKYPQQP